MNQDSFTLLPPLEYHPFAPFIPPKAKLLIMGTFPPQQKRWSMDFYYPNRTNDFWSIMGLIFLGDKHALYDPQEKRFNLEIIKALLSDKGIALSDTGYAVRRLRGNASDKFLEIVQPVDLCSLLKRMPECKGIASTGEKAAEVIAEITGSAPPRIGEYVVSKDNKKIWRMPSTSRAYPLSIEKKAIPYENMFRILDMI